MPNRPNAGIHRFIIATYPSTNREWSLTFHEKQRDQPVSAASALAFLWKRLLAVGNDPYLRSSTRAPSLLFDSMLIAGK